MKVIILAGEGGSSLFPLSRVEYPKYFLQVFDKTSLLQQSITRFSPIAKAEDIIIVTDEKYRHYVRNELNSVGMAEVHVILEPEFKNTVAAISLALNYCKNQLKCEDDETIFVSNSNYLISPVNVFLRNIRQGLSLTNKGKIVLFAVKPTMPAVDYGYMKMGEKIDEGYLVEEFIEKPDEKKAEECFADGKHYWNAGICVSQLGTFLNELEKEMPEIAVAAKLPFDEMLTKFKDLPDISMGNNILKKLPNMAMVLLNCFWNDISGWDDIYEVMNKDENHNAIQGDVIAVNCQNSLLFGKKRLLTGVGLTDILAVETDDVILVAKRDQVDIVKELVEKLKTQKTPEVYRRSTVFCSWGCYKVIESGSNYLVRRIMLEPGTSLKEQINECKSEHWTIIEGAGKVTIDGKEQIVNRNQSIFVPAGVRYKLSNAESIPLELLEVQNGEGIDAENIDLVED